jgi:hypothetical protein
MRARHKTAEIQQAREDLQSAIEARDIALGRATENVYRQFASIVAKREKAYNDALRRTRQEDDDEVAD